MIIVPAMPPQNVAGVGGFDYVAVDAKRRRVYAAHSAKFSLLIVDADTGKILRQVRVGEVHGVAFDPSAGTVFTGNGTDRSLSKIDPRTGRILRTVKVPGIVDAIAFDARANRVYGDEFNGTRIFVIDAATMKQVAVVPLPGHKPEYLALDETAQKLYQNIDHLSEVAVIDTQTAKVTKIIPTPVVRENHPLQLDILWGRMWVGGKNGVLAQYGLNGTLLHTVPLPGPVDQCTLDNIRHRIACAGSGHLTLIQDFQTEAPRVVASMKVSDDVGTVGADESTGDLWIVWNEGKHDFIQRLHVK
ncbi:MAG: hypothetical protein NVS9B12_00260 [Vulcanimicrobiaceae bacterium]